MAYSLQNMRMSDRTYENCMAALEKMGGRELQHVPKRLIDLKMCRLAMKKSPNIFKSVPEQFIEPWMCVEAVKAEPYLYKRVPKSMMTEEIYFYAMAHIPVEEDRTHQLLPGKNDYASVAWRYLEYLMKLDAHVDGVVLKKCDTHVIEIVARKNPFAIPHLPLERLSQDFIDMAKFGDMMMWLNLNIPGVGEILEKMFSQ